MLRVDHVIVCGHYGCGAVQSVLDGQPLGLIDNWLRNIETVYQQHRHIDALPADQRLNALCEYNVRAQVRAVCDSTVMRGAWGRGQDVTVHGWIYGIADGLVNDLGVSCASPAERVGLDATV